MTETELRAAIIAEAKTWVGTPFVDCARVKRAGVDCAQFIAAVYERILGKPIVIESYSPQWHLHRDEERYIAGLLAQGCRQIAEDEAEPGDVVLFKAGRCFSHGAIVVEWPLQIIHAVKSQRGVVYADPVRDKFVATRERKFFSFWG